MKYNLGWLICAGSNPHSLSLYMICSSNNPHVFPVPPLNLQFCFEISSFHGFHPLFNYVFRSFHRLSSVSPRFSWIFPRSWLFGLAPLGPWTRRAATAVGLGAWWSAVLRGGGARAPRALEGGAWKGCATWGGYLGGDQGQLRIWRMSIEKLSMFLCSPQRGVSIHNSIQKTSRTQ